MTKIVKQGANRAAWAARKARHAQRTPLPPPAVPRDAVRIARELAAEAKKCSVCGEPFVNRVSDCPYFADADHDAAALT